MATQTSKPTDNSTPVSGKALLVPPEEKFWVHYSPHHEFPLSTVSSFAVHVLVVGLLLLVAWVAVKLGLNADNKPADVDAITIVGGGGGAPEGVAGAQGDANSAAPPKDDFTQQPDPTVQKASPFEKLELPPGDIDPLQIPKLTDPTSARAIEEGNEALKRIASVDAAARTALFKGLQRSQGQGGSGTGGGKDKGKDTGQGDERGPGKGTAKLSERQKRVLRWTMIFNTLSGDDYRAQLQGLGAILAVPDPAQQGQYLVYENLTPPAHGEVKDLASIQRIYWVDDKPQSVEALATSLRLNPRPRAIVAFFPEKFEKELLTLEMAYAKAHRRNAAHLTEDDIIETKFEVHRGPDGYRPHVIFQR